MGLARQADCRQHLAAFGFDVTFQVRERAAHAHKVVYQNIFTTCPDNASEFSLPRHTRKAICACMCHHVDLRYRRVVWPSYGFADFNGKCIWNGIDAFSFISVCTD